MQDRKPLIIALDVDDADRARTLAAALDPALCRLKIGKELFVSAGPDLVRELRDSGFDIFLDLKFHDIPHTVHKAVKAAAGLGVWMLTVHASGGKSMLEAAREGAEATANAPHLLAVTVLTSMTGEDLEQIGIQRSPMEQVQRMAALAQESGMHGVVCSAQETEALRKLLHKRFLLVTPGIRPAGDPVGDQKRVMTPEQALRAGSDYLVIGRPVTRSRQPGQKLARIRDSLAGVIGDLC